MVSKYNAKAERIIKSRINQTKVYFAGPVEEILASLEKRGFIKRYKQNKSLLIPDAITKLIFLDHARIILRYNSIIRGFLNYFSFVDNLAKFHQIFSYILRHSCAKTLARKFNLKTRAGAFKKFGRDLGVTVERKKGIKKTYKLAIPRSLKKSRAFKINLARFKDPLLALPLRALASIPPKGGDC